MSTRHVREVLRSAQAAALEAGMTVRFEERCRAPHHALYVVSPDGRSLKTAVCCSPGDPHAHVVQVTQAVRRLIRQLKQGVCA